MELAFFSATPATVINDGTVDQFTAQRIVALVSSN